MPAPLLTVRNLRVRFGGLIAVDGLDLTLQAGGVLGIVGESGSGKSVGMLALMGLVDAPGVVEAEALRFDGVDLLRADARTRRGIVGRRVAMVFQDPQGSLNPSHRVGDQVAEVLRAHTALRGAALRARVLELFEQVGIPGARQRLMAYPHQLSGGMNQRVGIAMAIACGPALLIADEPTTALDVTVQAEVMALLSRLQREQGMALVLISHDLALVSEAVGDGQVTVMYAGQVVEQAAAPTLFAAPRHPYTAALLAALPDSALPGTRLPALPGTVPGRFDRPPGCLFAPRCHRASAACGAAPPQWQTGVRCLHPIEPAAPKQ
jgi:dipeptide transport system ATP-binding protein